MTVGGRTEDSNSAPLRRSKHQQVMRRVRKYAAAKLAKLSGSLICLLKVQRFEKITKGKIKAVY